MEFMNDDMDRPIRLIILLFQKAPWLIKPWYWFSFGRISQNPSKAEKFLKSVLFTLGDVDLKLLEDESIKKMLWEAFSTSYVQGSKGVAYDAGFDLNKYAWGFKLEEINFSDIHFWHGALDSAVPISMVEDMVVKISGATLKIYPEEGHLSLIFHHINEMIREM